MTKNTVTFDDGKRVRVDVGWDPDDAMGVYTAVSRLNVKNSRETNDEDIISRLCRLSKGARQLFDQYIKRYMDRCTNLSVFVDQLEPMSRSEKTIYNRRIKELIDVGLVKRTKTIDDLNPIPKGAIMVNPSMIIPSKGAVSIKRIWDYL